MKDRALALLYTDRMTVERYGRYETEYGETKEKLETVYQDVPCRISFTSTATPPRTDALPSMEYEATVFYDVSLELQANDVVTVTRGGRIYQGRAGLSAVYPRHGETPLAIFAR